ELQLCDVDAYFEALHAKGLSRVTIKIHANGVRAFLRHAERRAWCPTGLADLVAGPSIYRHHELPLGPSWDDVRKLIESTASAARRAGGHPRSRDPPALRRLRLARRRSRCSAAGRPRLGAGSPHRATVEAALAARLSARSFGRAGHQPLPPGRPPTMRLAPG